MSQPPTFTPGSTQSLALASIGQTSRTCQGLPRAGWRQRIRACVLQVARVDIVLVREERDLLSAERVEAELVEEGIVGPCEALQVVTGHLQ